MCRKNHDLLTNKRYIWWKQRKPSNLNIILQSKRLNLMVTIQFIRVGRFLYLFWFSTSAQWRYTLSYRSKNINQTNISVWAPQRSTFTSVHSNHWTLTINCIVIQPKNIKLWINLLYLKSWTTMHFLVYLCFYTNF